MRGKHVALNGVVDRLALFQSTGIAADGIGAMNAAPDHLSRGLLDAAAGEQLTVVPPSSRRFPRSWARGHGYVCRNQNRDICIVADTEMLGRVRPVDRAWIVSGDNAGTPPRKKVVAAIMIILGGCAAEALFRRPKARIRVANEIGILSCNQHVSNAATLRSGRITAPEHNSPLRGGVFHPI